MRIEIPECMRCCLCVPLRHGILVFGYLNLLFTLLSFSVELWLDFGFTNTSETIMLYRGVGMLVQIWLTNILYSLEVVFNVILIVGAHLKRMNLIRAYYYYGIMTTVAIFLAFIVVRYKIHSRDWYIDPFDLCLAFSGFVLHVYLLFLIRSELHKTRYQSEQFSYVNHLTEVVTNSPEDPRNPL